MSVYVVVFVVGFFIGVVVTMLVHHAMQPSGLKVAESAFAAEDKVTADAKAKREALAASQKEAHDAIDKLTPEEVDAVLNGPATLADVLRRRLQQGAAGFGQPTLGASVPSGNTTGAGPFRRV